MKVCELITHIKKFKGTKTLIQDFGMIADILGEHMGCFLFQLPPSFRYSRARLNLIVSQLDPARRNVVEFRHKSWWNNEVYSAFKEAGMLLQRPVPARRICPNGRGSLPAASRSDALVQARLYG